MGIHILIIEDERAIAETLAYACKEAGITFKHCSLGYEGIDAIRHGGFDLVVLDIGLPDLSGFDVCKAIRKESNIPVLFLTARNHEIDRIVGLEIGADDYVTKPFSPREVVTRIRAILRRTSAHLQTRKITSNKQFEIDPVANCIRYFGEPLSLTRYEFVLLQTLVERPKRVYSRAQLMDIVWVDAQDTLERTVDTHIKNLRRKLSKINPDSKAIVTHRGVGYSLYT